MQFSSSKARAGLPFLNYFVEVGNQTQNVTLQAYSAEFYSGDNIVMASYTLPKFLNGEILISEETKCFLENISNGSSFILAVFRGWLRTLITTMYDGRNYQSCIYLSGAPGTAKSVFAEIVKRFVNDKSRICEFSRDLNQFSGGSLENCQLLIISDLQQMNLKMLQFIKQILGRDTISKQIKYDPEHGTISTYCQVLIISNHKPQDFREFREDKATLDKLIHVEFPPEAAIPQDLQIANLAS